uniref:Cationic amino acid transporter 4 vacuolar isoform X2 n=1 Tax=Rhizophora mucronata TaxID=61149 RepID=A0A2P2PK45_RHIMU
MWRSVKMLAMLLILEVKEIERLWKKNKWHPDLKIKAIRNFTFLAKRNPQGHSDLGCPRCC